MYNFRLALKLKIKEYSKDEKIKTVELLESIFELAREICESKPPENKDELQPVIFSLFQQSAAFVRYELTKDDTQQQHFVEDHEIPF